VEQIPAYINLLSYLFVVLYMFSVPLESTRGEIIGHFKNFNLMGRALLANFVIIPVLGLIIAQFFDLPPDFRIGFLLLAMAPGGLLALQFARVSKGNRVFAAALLLGFCLLAILITPPFVYWFFPREGAGRLPFGWLTMMLILLIVVPLVLGRVLQKIIPEHAPKLGLWLGRLSIVIFIVAALMAGKY
jgi:BASS family bile acid:Na+ symporter